VIAVGTLETGYCTAQQHLLIAIEEHQVEASTNNPDRHSLHATIFNEVDITVHVQRIQCRACSHPKSGKLAAAPCFNPIYTMKLSMDPVNPPRTIPNVQRQCNACNRSYQAGTILRHVAQDVHAVVAAKHSAAMQGKSMRLAG
jgi:hypothetical protein